MKNNGKKLGVGGTIVVVILYALLQWTGIISPESGDGTDSSQSTIESSVAWDDTQATKAPAVTEKPKRTEAPETTETPLITEKPRATKKPEATEKPMATEAPKATEKPKTTATPAPTEAPVEIELTDYGFRNKKLRDSHFDKHGIEMGFETVEDYIEAANKVISNPDALHKLEAEDNDHIYFIEETNEFVVLSQDGYIRTYYIANGGIDYFNRQ
ncbi:MAG: hypothetical protein IJX63_13935 [Lachnospiraceae bacterium]|nr:hypothetical protein [Lachnospiraceae bacterium]